MSVDTVAKELEESMSRAETTALFIAWERALESKRDDALFCDPLAEELTGMCGKNMSKGMRAYTGAFGFGDWDAYHEQWTAVRTAYIDTWLTTKLEKMGDRAGDVQVVNLGAGVCTRPYRLVSLSAASSVFQVDLPAMTSFRTRIIGKAKSQPEPLVKRLEDVNCDLSEGVLAEALAGHNFDAVKPTLWILEGLLMYLTFDKQKSLLQELATLSSPGSSALINFMLQAPDAEPQPNLFAKESAVSLLKEQGWSSTEVHHFGGSALNYGRFPDNLPPNYAFSIIECTMD